MSELCAWHWECLTITAVPKLADVILEHCCFVIYICERVSFTVYISGSPNPSGASVQNEHSDFFCEKNNIQPKKKTLEV